jgi:hypothetical protein
VLQEFDVLKDGDLLLVPVTLAGKEYLFGLDTGCSVSVYDASLKHLLGKPRGAVVGATPNGDVKVALYDPPPASVGLLALRSATPVVAADLSRLRRACGHAVYGLVGMDYLKEFIVRIDFDKGEVSFLREVGPSPGRPIGLSRQGNDPFVDLPLPGLPAPVPFNVDTGCVRYGGIRAEEFGQLIERKQLALAGVTRSVTLRGVAVRRKGRLGTLSLGGFTHRGLVFEESQYSTLGLDYWSRYTVTFDFPAWTAYLKKGASFGRPAREDRSGLLLGRTGKRTVVDAVEEDSPAAVAGIKVGDEIITVAGRRAEELRMFAIHKMLCAEEGKLAITILREGQERVVSLMLGRQSKGGAGVD